MKAFLMILFLSLFISLTSKTPKQILICTFKTLSDRVCEHIIDNYKSGLIDIYIRDNKKLLNQAVNNCSN